MSVLGIQEQMDADADADSDGNYEYDLDELIGGMDGWPEDNEEDIEDTEQKNDTANDSDENDTENVLNEDGTGPITKERRLLTNKLACNLEQTLFPENYSPIELPEEC